MNKKLLIATVPMGMMLLMQGCIDDKYDLGNIDTTTQLIVDNLTLPVNIDAIKLDNIIDIDEDDPDNTIKIKTINGKQVYAVSQTGDFSSDDIIIDAFSAAIPAIEPAYATYNLISGASAPTKRLTTNANSITHNYHLHSTTPQKIDFAATGIDNAIKAITGLTMEPMHIDINLKADGVDNNTNLTLSNLTLNFVKGLTFESLPAGYSYDAVNGLLIIDHLDCVAHKASINLVADALDLEPLYNAHPAEATFVNHNLDMSSRIQIKEGDLTTTTDIDLSNSYTPKQQITFDIDTEVYTIVNNSKRPEMHPNTFSGKIEYKLEGNDLKIDPIDLDDLPDFLAQEGTNLKLANPQIFLHINNPVGDEKLDIQTGLTLTAIRPGSSISYSIDKNTTNPQGVITIGHNNGNKYYNIWISPSLDGVTAPDNTYNPRYSWVQFTGLSNVLSGNGLPTQIKIDLSDPKIPESTVKDFHLGKTLEGIKNGKYEFLAPLELKNDPGVQIVYSKIEDGWYDEDMEKLEIEHLQITATATSTIPLNANLTVRPLVMVDGKSGIYNDCEVTPLVLPGNSTQDITFSINALPGHTIKNLDGIRLQATVTPQSEESLSPNQTITLTNIKATVSGKYTTDF